MAVGQKITYKFHFTNRGKTPAINVRSECNCAIVQATTDIGQWWPTSGKPDLGITGEMAMAPNAESICIIDSDGIVSQDTLNDILAKRLFVYAWGRIFYGDTFGEKHTTTFCYVFDPNLKELTGYSQGNDMN